MLILAFSVLSMYMNQKRTAFGQAPMYAHTFIRWWVTQYHSDYISYIHIHLEFCHNSIDRRFIRRIERSKAMTPSLYVLTISWVGPAFCRASGREILKKESKSYNQEFSYILVEPHDPKKLALIMLSPVNSFSAFLSYQNPQIDQAYRNLQNQAPSPILQGPSSLHRLPPTSSNHSGGPLPSGKNQYSPYHAFGYGWLAKQSAVSGFEEFCPMDNGHYQQWNQSPTNHQTQFASLDCASPVELRLVSEPEDPRSLYNGHSSNPQAKDLEQQQWDIDSAPPYPEYQFPAWLENGLDFPTISGAYSSEQQVGTNGTMSDELFEESEPEFHSGKSILIRQMDSGQQSNKEPPGGCNWGPQTLEPSRLQEDRIVTEKLILQCGYCKLRFVRQINLDVSFSASYLWVLSSS